MSTVYKDNQNKYSPPSIVLRLFCEEYQNRNTVVSSNPLCFLDVGCNKGYVGKRLMAINSNAVVDGVDIDLDDLQEASKIYNEVMQVDLNNKNSFEMALGDKKYDYVLLLDILEHLDDPKETLILIRSILKVRSTLWVSLPNVANFSVRLPLLFGRFNYKESGILDRTHKHLYTNHSAKQLLQECGFEVQKVQYASDRFGAIIKRLPFLGTFLGYNLVYTAVLKEEQ